MDHADTFVYLTDHFWTHWPTGNLQTLNNRHQLMTPNPRIAVDDVVLLRDM